MIFEQPPLYRLNQTRYPLRLKVRKYVELLLDGSETLREEAHGGVHFNVEVGHEIVNVGANRVAFRSYSEDSNHCSISDASLNVGLRVNGKRDTWCIGSVVVNINLHEFECVLGRVQARAPWPADRARVREVFPLQELLVLSIC